MTTMLCIAQSSLLMATCTADSLDMAAGWVSMISRFARDGACVVCWVYDDCYWYGCARRDGVKLIVTKLH